MRKFIYFFTFVFLVNLGFSLEKKSAKLKKAEYMVHEAMEMMDLPEYGVKKLSKKGMYTSKDFVQAVTDMIREGRVLKDLDHPDEEYMTMNQEMLDSFNDLEAAVKAKDIKKIKTSLVVVNNTCKKCHDVYE